MKEAASGDTLRSPPRKKEEMLKHRKRARRLKRAEAESFSAGLETRRRARSEPRDPVDAHARAGAVDRRQRERSGARLHRQQRLARRGAPRRLRRRFVHELAALLDEARERIRARPRG